MTGHTKGPWIYINDWPDMRIESADGKYLIADYDTSFIEYPGDDETEANARLIAAAPDLLDALIDVIGWVPFGDAWHTGAPSAAVARARSAIAKAKGEQP